MNIEWGFCIKNVLIRLFCRHYIQNDKQIVIIKMLIFYLKFIH